MRRYSSGSSTGDSARGARRQYRRRYLPNRRSTAVANNSWQASGRGVVSGGRASCSERGHHLVVSSSAYLSVSYERSLYAATSRPTCSSSPWPAATFVIVTEMRAISGFLTLASSSFEHHSTEKLSTSLSRLGASNARTCCIGAVA